MSRDKELEKTLVKNADKNLATTAENTEAAAAIIPWASAGPTAEPAPVAEPAAESAVESAGPAASSVATAEKAAKEEVAEETAKQPTKPARRGFFDRIPGMRSGALWAYLLFVLVALYAFDYVTHAAADDIYVLPPGCCLPGGRPGRLPAVHLPHARPAVHLPAVCGAALLPARVPHRAAEYAADYRHYCALCYWCAYLLYAYARSRSWRLPLQKHPGSLGYGVADCGADLDVRPVAFDHAFWAD